jgi:hypothetical protein
VKRGNLKYWSNYMSVGNKFNHLKLDFILNISWKIHFLVDFTKLISFAASYSTK